MLGLEDYRDKLFPADEVPGNVVEENANIKTEDITGDKDKDV